MIERKESISCETADDLVDRVRLFSSHPLISGDVQKNSWTRHWQ